jgi:16S rRNA (adenine1518-N6/adenine1519-N6)-dimethyltransferase
MDRREINAILGSAGLRPQHQFGQNFMVDQNILGAIADSGGIEPGDVVLEVGPGVGNLTRQLSKRAGDEGAVLAVDIDRKLMPAAQRHHADLKNVHWLLTDVLAGKHAIEPAVIEKLRELRRVRAGGALRLVSNLPYNAASPLVAELLVEMWREVKAGGRELLFERLAFTVQYEVGLRMRAVPDTRDYGPLGILIQLLSKEREGVEIVRKIPAGAFWPPPKIQSALVVVRPDVERMRLVRDAVALQGMLSAIFSHRRQTLGNALKHWLGDGWTPGLKERVIGAGFDVAKRAEVFPAGEFLRLAEVVRGAG